MASTLEVLTAAQVALLMNKPCATLLLTTGQSVSTSTNTQVSWNSASGDIWGGWSSGSPTRWTVPVAGWYKLEATIMWPSNATGARHAEFYQNGVENTNSTTVWNPSPGANQFPQPVNPVIIQCSVGDYLQVNLWQNSGGTLTTATVGTFVIAFEHF